MLSNRYLSALATGLLVARTGALPNGLDIRQNTGFVYFATQGCAHGDGGIRPQLINGQDHSQCTIYNSANTFPSSYQQADGSWNVFFNTHDAMNSGFVTEVVIRSPAGTDQDGCGVPIRTIKTPGCYQDSLSSTFLLQYCINGSDCDGIQDEVELAQSMMAANPGPINATAFHEANAARKAAKKLKARALEIEQVAREVRDADMKARTEASQAESAARALAGLQDLAKRADCSNLSGNGGTYTKLSDKTYKASTTQACSASQGGTCGVAVGKTESVSYTLSVSTSAGIEGLFSTELGFSLTNENSASITETFQQTGGSVGYVSWTPIMICQDGTLSGCSGSNGVNDGPVTGCTAHQIKVGGSDQSFTDGVYSFVATS